MEIGGGREHEELAERRGRKHREATAETQEKASIIALLSCLHGYIQSEQHFFWHRDLLTFMNSYKHLANSMGIGGCTQNARRMDVYMSGKKTFVSF